MATKKNTQKSVIGTTKPKRPRKKLMKMAARVRRECSKLSAEEREVLLQSALERIGGKVR